MVERLSRTTSSGASITFRRGIGLILLVALAVRAGLYVGWQRGRPFGFNDSNYYAQQASALVRGRWFIDPVSGAAGAEHGPLTSVLVAPLSWMDDPQNWQRLATIVTGLGCVIAIGLVGRLVGTPDGEEAPHPRSVAIGLTAAAIAAVYPNLWLNDGLVMSESVATLVVAIWMVLGLRAAHRLRTGHAVRFVVMFGACGGLAALVRSELLLLSGVAALILWRSTRERSTVSRVKLLGLLVTATVLVLAPWVVPNLVRFDRPVVLNTNDGTTLRGANCDRTYHGREMGSWSVFCLADEPSTIGLETSRRSALWRSEGLGYERRHAGRVPLVLAARVGRTLDLFRLDHMLDEDVRDGRPRLGSMLGIASFWLLAPLAVVGLWRRRSSDRLVLWAPVVVVAISTLAFYGGHRIRTPLEPVVVVGAAVAIVERVRPGARTTTR